MGQLEALKGRKGEHYWPLKTFGESALESGANRANVSGEVKGIVSRPLSITFVGLRDTLRNGTLNACDGQQWWLYHGKSTLNHNLKEYGYFFQSSNKQIRAI